MKTVLKAIALTALTSTLAYAMPASDYTIRVNADRNRADVTVLKSGQPVSDVAVKVIGNGTQTFVTGSKGTFMAANLLDNGRTFTFELIDENGNKIREQRYLSSF
ncbi:hypothetical protein L4C33_09605 [Vibrio makurazakiensis]|uniref:hypothetical protein n=1 Tax=Vibrio makurazakiensis TaxID=2910250 RepID=UPI003D1045B3